MITFIKKLIYNKYVYNSIILFFFEIVLKLTNIGINIFFIQVFTKELYGEYTFFSNTILLLIALFSPALIEVLFREYIEKKSNGVEQGRQILTSILIINFSVVLILFIIFAFVFPFIHNIFSFKILSSFLFLIVLFVSVLANAFIELFIAFNQSNEKFKKAGLLRPIRAILLLLLLLGVLIYNKLTFENVSILIMVSYLIPAIVLLKKDFRFSFAFKNNLKHVLYLIKTYKLFFIYFLILALYAQSDIYFISHYFSTEELAEYGVAVRYYSMLLSLLPSISIIIKMKYFTKEVITDTNVQKKYALKWIKYTLPVAMGIYILLFFLTPIVFPILNGDMYDDSILLFRILSFGAIISYILSPNVALLFSQNKIKLLVLTALFTLLFNIFGNLYVISKYRIIGVTFVTVLSHFVLNFIGNLIFFYKTKFS